MSFTAGRGISIEDWVQHVLSLSEVASIYRLSGGSFALLPHTTKTCVAARVGRAHCLGLDGRRRDRAGPPNRHPRMSVDDRSKFFRTCVDRVDARAASMPVRCRTETTRRWVASALSPCVGRCVDIGDLETHTTAGSTEIDGWAAENGRGVGYARLGERILVALEIHHAAPFERRDYAAATRNGTPRIPGPPILTRMSFL